MKDGVLVSVEGNTEFPAEILQLVFGVPTEGIRIAIEEEGSGAGLNQDFPEGLHRGAAADDEAAAKIGDGFGESPKASAEEILPGSASPEVTSHPAAGHVDRDDLTPEFGRMVQAGIVSNPEVTPEPVDDAGISIIGVGPNRLCNI